MPLWLALLAVAALPTDFGDPPAELVPFCQYMVQRRAAEGLNRVVRTEGDPNYGTIYGGNPEDANIAWVAAAAYRGEFSRFHGDAALRDEAFFLLDNLARIHADGRWDDGGLSAWFGIHSFAWAVLSWLETGDVDEPRAAVWRAAVAAAADDAIDAMGHHLLPGDYANPEFYYLSGLAAAWKITGNQMYREEAARALRRYDDRLWPGGGVPYFRESTPEHGYQQMVTKGVALYYDLTGDEHAMVWLRRLADYFPRIQHPSGLIADSGVPHLKHGLYSPLNPAVPAMIALLTSDGRNRTCADIATVKRRDNVLETMPPFFPQNPNWYNYHHTTYAAIVLRLLERHTLPDPVAPPTEWVGFDPDFRGVRSVWGTFLVEGGTRPMNDVQAGAWLADPAVIMEPLNAAVRGVYFEVLEGDRSEAATAAERIRAHYRALGPTPLVQVNSADGFASVSCLTRLCAPYWNDLPWIPGERWALNEVSDWTSLQHWAVWRDHLIGLGALRYRGPGGGLPATDDQARVRWSFAPVTAALRCDEVDESHWRGGVGGLDLRVEKLEERGEFLFGDIADQAPNTAAGLILAHSAPWQTGEFLHVAQDIHPTASDTQVGFKPLTEGGAAAMLDPGGRTGWLWVANLHRHWRHYTLRLPDGLTVTAYRRGSPMPPVLPGRPAALALSGGESGVWRLTSAMPLSAEEILAGLESSWGRGEARAER